MPEYTYQCDRCGKQHHIEQSMQKAMQREAGGHAGVQWQCKEDNCIGIMRRVYDDTPAHFIGDGFTKGGDKTKKKGWRDG